MGVNEIVHVALTFNNKNCIHTTSIYVYVCSKMKREGKLNDPVDFLRERDQKVYK